MPQKLPSEFAPGPIVRRWRVLAAICVFFAARGMFYACATPLWEGFDEPAEYALIESSRGSLLSPEAGVSPVIEASLRAAPLPRAVAIRQENYISHDDFWRLPEEARRTREQSLRSLAGATGGEAGRSPDTGRGSRPPLYYWLMRPVAAGLRTVPLLDRVFLLRVFNVLLATLAVPLAFLLARDVLQDDAAALCATAALSAVPQVMMNVSHVGGEALTLVLATALALAAMHAGSIGRGMVLGIALGLGMLADFYFAALLAACVLVLFLRWRVALAAVAVAAAISGWWYARAWMAWSGTRGTGFLEALGKVDWLRAADFTWNTFVWSGNGSFLGLRSWVYRIMLLAFLIALLGLTRAGRQWSAPVWTLVAFHLALAAALAWNGIENVRTGGMPATPGWHLCLLAAGGLCLAVYGFRSLTPGARAIPVFAFAALDLYGLHVVLMPYYAGLISYSSSGRLGAFPLGRWSYVVFDRLAANKPYWLGSTVLSGLWAGYIVATFALIGIAVWLRRQEQSPSVRITTK